MSASVSAATREFEERVAAVDSRSDPSSLDDQLYNGWPSISFGIILAGGLYPIVLGITFAGMDTLFTAGWPSVAEFVVTCLALVPYSLISGMVGLLWTNFVLAVTMPVVYLFLWSLKLRGSILWLGAFCGGLIGFIAVLPFLFMLIVEDIDGLWEIMVMFGLGPGLTTVMGQLGGVWGARRALQRASWYEEAVAIATVEEPAGTTEQTSVEDEFAITTPSPSRLQFGIRHLLWIAVWVSLLLSFIRVCGIPFELALPLLISWIFYQAATLWGGALLARRLDPWWRARTQSRST